MNRRDRRATGQKATHSSHSPAAPTIDALHEAGLGHLRAGRTLDAQTCCQRALAIDSSHADTLHLLGLLSARAQDDDHAVEWITRAIRQDPKPEYLASLGTTLQQQGRLEEALQVFDKAAQLRPDDGELWISLGKILEELNRPDEALLSFQHVLELDPRHWEAANRAGILLHGLGRVEEALSCFNLCDRIQPNHVPTLYTRGRTLMDLGRFEEALADNRRAHALDPAIPDICDSIGSILRRLNQPAEALQWFDRALRLQPNFVSALINKAGLLGEMQRFDECLAIYADLKAIDPENAEAEWNRSLVQLLTRNFEAGWAGREARWRVPSLSVPFLKVSQPTWSGDGTIEGKTLLIWVDEGLGDTIQFARYVPMLAERGARVILFVQDAVVPLLSGLPGVSQCVSSSTPARLGFDLHCPLGSLPLAFGTKLETIPSDIIPASGSRDLQASLGRPARFPRSVAGRTGLVGQSEAQKRSQSIDLAANAFAHPRPRCDLRESAEGSKG